jgi:uncharacterized membrane protein YhaH (DUF805 family)
MSEITINEATAMGIGKAVKSAFGQYGTFAGRARRAEFWWFMLFVSLVSIGADILDAAIFQPMVWRGTAGPIGSLWTLATLLPSISVSVRRLHDLDRSGWWWWLWLVPVIGWIVLLIWFASRGTDGPNRFGVDPLAAPRI